MANEIGRKVVHVIAGVLIILGALYMQEAYSLELFKLIIFGFLVISLFIDFLIADLSLPIPVYNAVQRRKELTGMHSATFYLIGTLLAFQFFSFEIALTSIGILTVGDAFAAILGKMWGTPFYRKKSIVGSVAMFLASIGVGVLFLSNPFVILFMAGAGTVVEIFVDKIDDNIMIPVFSGIMGQLISVFS